MLLLNDFNGKIKINNTDHNLVGTFVVKFSNTSVSIDDKIFRSLQAPPLNVLPASLQPTPMENKWENLLTLQSLNELHINNTHQIRLLRIGTVASEASLVLIIVISGIIVLLIRQRGSSKKLIINDTTTIELGTNPMASNTLPTPTSNPPHNNFDCNVKFNDLPYF